jgi:pyridoxine 5-phosphate synthase
MHRFAGRRTSVPIAWSCTPSRSPARSRKAGPAHYTSAAEVAHSLGLGVNAGHDLDLENLVVFRRLPHLDEVSIGHALISHALFVGLAKSVREYLDVLAA